jgi:hypothetical protein
MRSPMLTGGSYCDGAASANYLGFVQLASIRLGCALLDPLVQNCAPRPINLHYHSGSLFSPPCEGQSVPMHVECGVVSIDFVQENFCIVIVRRRDFELQGSKFIFQA